MLQILLWKINEEFDNELKKKFGHDPFASNESKRSNKRINKNILIESGSQRGLPQEAPKAYKDIDEVVKVSHEVGIGNLVAKIKPLLVMKGWKLWFSKTIFHN